jgi:hypothetical protein
MTLTAYEDTSQRCWRVDRLLRVVGYVQCLAEHYGNNSLLERVVNLHERKGLLEVTWRTKPTQGEKEFFARAWESSVADEDGGNVTHKVLCFS